MKIAGRLTPSGCTLKIITVVSVGIMATGFGLSACQRGTAGKVEPITLGIVPTAAIALIYIAQEQQFFAANRLGIIVKEYSTGTATTDALLKEELDMAWVAEFPFVRRAFAREKISIIAVIDRFNEQYLFGLKERGINVVSDLKGKKIGIPRNTIAEFYLGRFLELNGMNIQDTFLVDVPPAGSMEAVIGGSLDGIIVWEPFCSQLRMKLADGAVTFPIQSSQPGYGAIAVRNDWIRRYPETVNRFLKSLVQAENYLSRNPAGAKAIVRKQLNYDEAFTETIWSENQFSLSLDQSLIVAMEDEARWMIRNGQTMEIQVPDFMDHIYTKGLEAVNPEAVSVIR